MSAQGKSRAVKSKPTPCPSTIPEAGLDLSHAVTAYREWLVEQALIRTNGNVSEAARLLNVKRTTLDRMRHRLSQVRLVPRLVPGLRALASNETDPDTGVHAKGEAQSGGDGVMRFSPRRVAEMKARGLNNAQIGNELGCNRYMVERLLREATGLAKCGARKDGARV
jgi:hypothetical protein